MAAGSTYTPIATTTLGSAAASYTFSSIPSTYTDLVLVFNGSTTSGNLMRIRLNGDTGSNYSVTMLWGTGSSAVSARYSDSWVWAIPDGAGAMQNAILNFQNYSNTTTYKTTLTRASLPGASVTAAVSLWRSTAAINSIEVALSSNEYSAGSTFTLYGIAAA